MKKINEYINENLVTETNGELVVFFDHFRPEDTYIIKGVTDKKLIKELDGNFELATCPFVPGNIYDIVHSDEMDYVNDTKCKSELQLKNAILKGIKDSLKEIEPGYVQVDFSPLGVENEFVDVDEKDSKNPQYFYKWVVDFYKNSSIDGDSESARVVWDSKTNEIVFGSEYLYPIVFESQEEFKKYREENWGE